jgi:hypothetical protein
LSRILISALVDICLCRWGIGTFFDFYDREIAGLIASSLAYGRVAQILKSVSFVLRIMEASPYLFLKKTANKSINKAFSGFTHRFATGEKISAMLIGVKYVIKQFAAAGNQGAGQRIFGQCLLSQLDNLLPKQALKPTKRKVVWKKLPHLI